MKNVIDFLTALSSNNNKPWFDANKGWFKDAQKEFNDFTLRLIEGVEAFDSSISGLQLKDCSYRIYRDVRFSGDKTPYKTYMGAYVAPEGKRSGYSGYYFHIEPRIEGAQGGHLLAVGAHCPQPKVLESIRTDIYDDPKGFIELIKRVKGFELDSDNKLKRVPRGFPSDFEYADYLMHRDYSISRPMSNEEALSSDLLELVLSNFKKAMPFAAMLNKATKYAYQEMM